MTKRILVVEDQEDNRQILRDLLANAGFEMIEAEDGVQAIAAASQHRPDLILMDIQLPTLDGYEATRRIKADPALAAIPIIVVTSYALSGDEDKARAAGCDAYVAKPYTLTDLRNELADLSADRAFADAVFDRFIEGREVMDYAHLLSLAGYVMRPVGAGRAWMGDVAARETGDGLQIGAGGFVASPLPVPFGTPAYDAGLDEGDTLTAIDGQPATSAASRPQPGPATSSQASNSSSGGRRATRPLIADEPPRPRPRG